MLIQLWAGLRLDPDMEGELGKKYWLQMAGRETPREGDVVPHTKTVYVTEE